jgi:hypothetical protein
LLSFLKKSSRLLKTLQDDDGAPWSDFDAWYAIKDPEEFEKELEAKLEALELEAAADVKLDKGKKDDSLEILKRLSHKGLPEEEKRRLQEMDEPLKSLIDIEHIENYDEDIDKSNLGVQVHVATKNKITQTEIIPKEVEKIPREMPLPLPTKFNLKRSISLSSISLIGDKKYC